MDVPDRLGDLCLDYALPDCFNMVPRVYFLGLVVLDTASNGLMSPMLRQIERCVHHPRFLGVSKGNNFKTADSGNSSSCWLLLIGIFS